MKRIAIFTFVVVHCFCVAAADKPLDTARYFAFPDTVVVIDSGDTKATAHCSQCYSYPTPQQPEPHFSGGHEFEGGTFVKWEFVRQTHRGDVYLIIVNRPGKPEIVTPILFTGKAQTVVSDRNLKVELLPEPPKNSNEHAG